MLHPLSVAIITFNEEKNIARCIESVKKIADDIVVVDSYSTDKTIEIAQQLGARVVLNKFPGHIEQKNFAITQAKYPLVLSLDADEAIDEMFEREIIAIKNQPNIAAAYNTNRYNNYCGQWINFGAWKNDWKLRLWDSTKGQWGGMNPHDRFTLRNANDEVIELNGKILHWSYYTVAEHKQRATKYAEIAATAYLKQGKKSSLFKIYFSPIFRFVRDYFVKLGFLDGKYGFIIAKITAQEVYLKYKKLLQLYQTK